MLVLNTVVGLPALPDVCASVAARIAATKSLARAAGTRQLFVNIIGYARFHRAWPGQRESLRRRSLAYGHRLDGGSQWPSVGNQMANWLSCTEGRPRASRM